MLNFTCDYVRIGYAASTHGMHTNGISRFLASALVPGYDDNETIKSMQDSAGLCQWHCNIALPTTRSGVQVIISAAVGACSDRGLYLHGDWESERGEGALTGSADRRTGG